MSAQRKTLITLLVLQVVAVLLYPPTFFADTKQAQAIILLPVLSFLIALVVVTMNFGWLDMLSGRSSMVFIQGINIVARILMLIPNLKNPAGAWNGWFMVLDIVAIGISWYTIMQIEKLPLRDLLLRQPEPVN